MNKPTLGEIVHYRGKHGLFAMRAAIVVADVNSLMPEGVELGEVLPLSSDMHVHLHVFTPGALGWFSESNVAHGVPGDDGMIPPGTWAWPVIK